MSEPVLRRDAARNRERILAAAQEVFGELGHRAGVEEIARRAGVGMGTLYRRFPTKEALVDELVRQFVVEVAELAEVARAAPEGMGLEQFMVRAGEMLSAHHRFLLVSKPWSDGPSAAATVALYECMAALLADAHRCGCIRPDIELGDVELALWATSGLIGVTREAAPNAWRRHLATILAGMRPGAASIDEPALTPSQVARVRALDATDLLATERPRTWDAPHESS